MGAIAGLLGLGGGTSGTNYKLTQGTDAGQLGAAYNGAQNSLQSQQALLNALQQQNGIGNQSQVYGQLQDVVAGRGPNPAQAMLANSTGQNVAQQAALAAGQRGASANAGLIARQAAQAGAGAQQQAAGQAAALQAQQGLGALGQAQQLATQQVGQQMAGTQANTAAQQGEQSILQNANAQSNNANAELAKQQMQGQQSTMGGIFGGIGAAFGLADGGEVPDAPPAPSGPQSTFGRFMSGMGKGIGGGAGVNPLTAGLTSLGGAVGSGIGSLFRGPQAAPSDYDKPSDNWTGTGATNGPQMPMGFYPQPAPLMQSQGGKVPALVSPGEKYLSPEEARSVAKGKESPMNLGQTIPGKAKVSGDSQKNDTVPAMLEPGGVVVKRSIMNSKDAEDKAAKFVQAVLAKKGIK